MLGGFGSGVVRAPIPGKQFVEAIGWMVEQAGKYVGEPGRFPAAVKVSGGSCVALSSDRPATIFFSLPFSFELA